MKCNCRCWMKTLAAILSRLLYALHGGTLAVFVIIITKNSFYFILFTGIALLFIEMIVTLKLTKYGEWKWFSPMVFLYLCSVIPSIFVLEIENLQFRSNITNVTHPECTDNDVYTAVSKEVQSAEECTILVLILGRWLMPRGKMTRDQLAQLLLIYLALGADMLDILELMKEPSVKTNMAITVVGLCLFTWAVMQFTLVLTQTFPAPSPGEEDEVRFHSSSEINNCIHSLCCTGEVWTVIISVAMQDGPFLIYRLYLVTIEGVFNESMTFFICKNILTVLIQIYRIIVFLCDENHKRKEYKQSHMNLE